MARRRRASANRILSVFRALLNHAWRDGRTPSDHAWRRLRPFRNVSEPLVRYLSQDEARRLINASVSKADDRDLQRLVHGALLTGCRHGELVAMRVHDYRAPRSAADAGAVYVRESKSGRPRSIPLNDEGNAFFEELCAGRSGAEHMLTRQGAPWGKNHHVRDLAAACDRARIAPRAGLHVLRHTYASWLAMRGVALHIIAELLGHADTRITKRHYAHLAPSYVAQVVREHLPALTLAPAPAKVRVLRGAGRGRKPAAGVPALSA